jgi:acetoin utilization protein AcuB
MRIRDVMTKSPVTVSSDALVFDARRIMKEKNFRRLPVVDKGKLLGVVTLQDINEAVPPPTDSSSAHQYYSIYSKMKVKEIMKTNPFTVSPDTPFEQVLKIGQDKKISSYLVVENGKLVGIATESDLVRFVTRVLGLQDEGARITIEGLGGEPGELQQVISILDQHKTAVLSMMSFQKADKKDWMMVLRLKTRTPEAIVNDLKKKGFKVTYVT